MSRILTIAAALILGVVISNAQPPAGDASRARIYTTGSLCAAPVTAFRDRMAWARLVPIKLTQTAFMKYVRHPHD
jgi:hypothetical protein